MNHIIIRTCPKDEFISMLAYQSFVMAGIKGEYSFCAENGNYSGLLNDHKIVYRHESNNFGGQLGVKGLLAALRKYEFNPGDTIIVSDSDIIVRKNFTKLFKDTDHFGTGGIHNGLSHISGQMQVLSYNLIQFLLSFSIADIDKIVQEMLAKGFNIADDSFISYITDKHTQFNKLLIDNSNELWIHKKYYELQNTGDYESIINNILENEASSNI